MRFLGALWVFSCVSAIAPIAHADTIPVRSGEHGDFTRIVVDVPGGTGWELGREGAVYELRLDRRDADFELGRVFVAIPRDRVSDVAALPGGGRLAITMGCDCHAKVFVTANGGVALDVREGASTEGAAYETPLPPFGEDTQTAEASGVPARRPASLAQVAPRPALADDHAVALPVSPPRAAAVLPLGAPALPLPPGLTSGPAFSAAPEEGHLDRRERAQAILLEQLSRAASQGLVEVETDLPRPARPGQGTETSQAETPERPETAERDAPEEPLRARTSVEAHLRLVDAADAVTSAGETCPPEDRFALGDWQSDLPPAAQIGQARQALIGEFDRPDPEKVRALARLYISLSMGAEAIAVLHAFDEADQMLVAIAEALDEKQGNASGLLARYAGCPTAAALWAVLTAPDPLALHDVDGKAILRAFAEYPDGVRRTIAPRLLSFFIASRDEHSARILRNAIERGVVENAGVVALADAQIALDARLPGDTEAVDALALSNDPLAPRATLAAIAARLSDRQPVPEGLAAHAEALAFTVGEDALASELAASAALAWASASVFERGWDVLDRSFETMPPDLRARTLTQYAQLLSDRADEAQFLRFVFSRPDWAADGAMGEQVSSVVARRVSDLGFHERATEFIGVADVMTDSARLVLARGDLAAGRLDAGLARLAGLSAEGGALRARIHLAAGDADTAVEEYLAVNDRDAAAAAAWSSGLWARAKDLSTGIRSRALEVALPPEDAAGSEPPTLASSRDLVERSQEMRAVFDELLSDANL